jgi:hypothetical protein
MIKLSLLAIVLIVYTGSLLQAQPKSVKKSVNDKVVGSTREPISINNSFMVVTYDTKTKSLEVATKSRSKTFLKNLLPNGATGAVRKENTLSPTFGKGSALVITTAGGGSISFTLYPSQPFLFVNQIINNTSTKLADIQKLNPVSFSVDLGKPATPINDFRNRWPS